jgi:hypothetical protein
LNVSAMRGIGLLRFVDSGVVPLTLVGV